MSPHGPVKTFHRPIHPRTGLSESGINILNFSNCCQIALRMMSTIYHLTTGAWNVPFLPVFSNIWYYQTCIFCDSNKIKKNTLLWFNFSEKWGSSKSWTFLHIFNYLGFPDNETQVQDLSTKGAPEWVPHERTCQPTLTSHLPPLKVNRTPHVFTAPPFPQPFPSLDGSILNLIFQCVPHLLSLIQPWMPSEDPTCHAFLTCKSYYSSPVLESQCLKKVWVVFLAFVPGHSRPLFPKICESCVVTMHHIPLLMAAALCLGPFSFSLPETLDLHPLPWNIQHVFPHFPSQWAPLSTLPRKWNYSKLLLLLHIHLAHRSTYLPSQQLSVFKFMSRVRVFSVH